jgi:hypothetical protein
MRRWLITLTWLLVATGCREKPAPVIPTSGLQLWLKADEGVTTSGSRVKRWGDQSGNGNDAHQADPERQPFLVEGQLNGQPVIRFDGVDDRLGLSGTNQMSAISLFLVFKLDSGRDQYLPIVFGDVDGEGVVWGISLRSEATGYSPDKISIFTGFFGGMQAEAAQCAMFDRWYNISVVTDRTMRSTTLRTNGVDAHVARLDPNAPNLTISVPLGNSTGTGVGGIGGTDEVRAPIYHTATRCEVAEVIVYASVLSDSARRGVGQYLGAKYHLP